jgi:hypothetical protein
MIEQKPDRSQKTQGEGAGPYWLNWSSIGGRSIEQKKEKRDWARDITVRSIVLEFEGE